MELADQGSQSFTRISEGQQTNSALGYADVALFFCCVLVLALGSRIAVRLGIVSPATLENPSLAVQLILSAYLLAALYSIVRIRHGQNTRTRLGWTTPSPRYLAKAILGGLGLGLVVDLIAHASAVVSHPIRLWDFILLDTCLGPLIEESFFRGCLLPVIARATGSAIAVVATALLFAALHPMSTPLQFACFTLTGVAYGRMQIKSGSTAAATLMHATYNVALFLSQIF